MSPENYSHDDVKSAAFGSKIFLVFGLGLLAFGIGYSVWTAPERMGRFDPVAETVPVTKISDSPLAHYGRAKVKGMVQLDLAESYEFEFHTGAGTDTITLVPMTGPGWKQGDLVPAFVRLRLNWQADRQSEAESAIIARMQNTSKQDSETINQATTSQSGNTLAITSETYDETQTLFQHYPVFMEIMTDAGFVIDQNVMFLDLTDPYIEPLWWRLTDIFSEPGLIFFLIGFGLSSVMVLLRIRIKRHLRTVEA